MDFNDDAMEIAEITFHASAGGFSPEIRSLRSTRHPNITPVYLLTECFKQFLLALNQNKNVFCEKPGTLSTHSLLKLISHSEVKDVCFYVDDVLIYALYPTTGLKFLRLSLIHI